jgi:hypothetical protein
VERASVSQNNGATHQWRRNFETFHNGRSISSVNSNALANATTGDIGLYDCILTSVCGRSATQAAAASVEPLPECPGFCDDIDFKNDGSVFDPCDINAFLLASPKVPARHAASDEPSST